MRVAFPKNSGELVEVRQGADYRIAEGSRCCTNAAPEDAMGRHKKRARRLVRRSTRQFIDASRQSRPLHRFCRRLRDCRRKQHHPASSAMRSQRRAAHGSASVQGHRLACFPPYWVGQCASKVFKPSGAPPAEAARPEARRRSRQRLPAASAFPAHVPKISRNC